MSVGLYRRLSERKATDDATDATLARQEADGRALADRNGWTVAEVYSDVDSAYRPANGKVPPRAGFERAWRTWPRGTSTGWSLEARPAGAGSRRL